MARNEIVGRSTEHWSLNTKRKQLSKKTRQMKPKCSHWLPHHGHQVNIKAKKQAASSGSVWTHQVCSWGDATNARVWTWPVMLWQSGLYGQQIFHGRVWKCDYESESVEDDHSVFMSSSEHVHVLLHLILTVKPSHMTQAWLLWVTSKWTEEVAWGEEEQKLPAHTTGKKEAAIPPFPLPSIISFPIPLSPLTRDSFLLASHLSPPLGSSPSPGTKHTPDRLPWKRLTHTLSLSLCLTDTLPLSPSLTCSGNACILSLLH